MPIIKSAKKKMRQDKKRTLQNKKYELAYKKIIDKAKKYKKSPPAVREVGKTDELLRTAYQAIDKAAKKHVIHKNKASRLKGMVARLLQK
ncbi:30S ribosomal protein S20 [Candidatus Roizmanbacteria bacterium RIFCSPLOWO2_01_FULL_37_12]|uniref:Small ribosomal subunit protein bS20 n=1 Tax=Candidatus Roizmanbacteria bacterium RIFCSPLOWO2_01_FULL_37_12 TaxID=1802056 RepID=A0A1F7I838_9BACT|nr:MAG: 30S ribosomal protein S20 [Candidatus Roizmanbacteria bacterium RIFCSPHIGHO2_02_FULL_37_9b]OGK39530.1 MAG: 30S ribosomal protein S20 [Candidatus Roizmanbacteria bacterium RIFCSPLOWO2_01_FULL_37_12]